MRRGGPPSATVSALRIGSAQLLERAEAAAVLFDGIDLGRTLVQKGAGQSTGAGAHLDGRAVRQFPRRPRDAPRQVEVEEKVLAQRLCGAQAVARDNVTQRREVRALGHGLRVAGASSRLGPRPGYGPCLGRVCRP